MGFFAFLKPPELSEAERGRERRRQEIASALRRSRSRLDRVHGLRRLKKLEEVGASAAQLLIDLANLLRFLDQGEPVSSPAAAAEVFVDAGLGPDWIRPHLDALVQDVDIDVFTFAELADILFWAVRARAQRVMRRALKTSLAHHELKLRWMLAAVVVLTACLGVALFIHRQRSESRQFKARLDRVPAVATVDTRGPFLRKWLLTDRIDAPHGFGRCIDIDFLETADCETRILPTPGMRSRLIDGSVATWNRIESPTDSIDLTDLVGNHEDSVVYAFTTLYSPRLQAATLFLGSDDGIKVWLNGKTVFNLSGLRGLTPDENRVRVTLRKGVNALLLKITQRNGGWGFTCRIAPPAEKRSSSWTSRKTP